MVRCLIAEDYLKIVKYLRAGRYLAARRSEIEACLMTSKYLGIEDYPTDVAL